MGHHKVADINHKRILLTGAGLLGAVIVSLYIHGAKNCIKNGGNLIIHDSRLTCHIVFGNR